MTVPELVRFVRFHKRLTQQQLAKLLGVSHSTISGVENNRASTPLPRLEQLQVLSKLVGAEIVLEVRNGAVIVTNAAELVSGRSAA